MKRQAFGDASVKAVFAAYPSASRADLLKLRDLIFEAAAETAGVGTLIETLKWGQPAYLRARPKIGSTIRIDALRARPGGFAMFFHCRTTLVDTFRELYAEKFVFEGNRAIRFSRGEALPRAALKHCIALALTYHSKARRI